MNLPFRAFRNPSVRDRVIALLLVLTLLWIFAGWVVLRESYNLLYVGVIGSDGIVGESVVDALQQERRLSAAGAAGGGSVPGLDDVRRRTDDAVAEWLDTTSGPLRERLIYSRELTQRVDQFNRQLAEISSIRDQVDQQHADLAHVTDTYTTMIEAGFTVYGAMSSLDDQQVARQSFLLTELSRARELISQQDALLSGTSGTLTAAQQAEFASLVATQRFLHDRTADALMPTIRDRYHDAADSAAMQELRALQDHVVATGALPETAEGGDWASTAAAAMDVMRGAELGGADDLIRHTVPIALGILARLLLAGVLGLVALLLCIRTARHLVRQLSWLRDAADELADKRLPDVVHRLSTGTPVDAVAAAPPLEAGRDELGQLAGAFNRVHQTAVEAAVGQAELRRGVRDVFLSLARRTQSLVHRQIRVLDTAERHEEDPERVARLFEVDHLATRMRRNAENLIVLAGDSTGRSWRNPVAIVDVIRGAVSEVEDYRRVQVAHVDTADLHGRVVGDVIHLLAELIENATSYSPPYAPVSITGQRVAHGYAIEIEDRGLGMVDHELVDANQQLANPRAYDDVDPAHLGLTIVGRLAQRHGIKVHLRRSPYGGVTAIALLPASLLGTPLDDPIPAAAQSPETPPPAAERDHPAARHAAAAAPAPVAPPASPEPPASTAPPASPAPPASSASQASPASPVSPAPPASRAAPSASRQEGESEPAGASAPLRTPSGLPWRVRQANLPAGLATAAPGDASTTTPAPADPEQVRQRMTAFQQGTNRGRQDATANLTGGTHGSVTDSGDGNRQ